MLTGKNGGWFADVIKDFDMRYFEIVVLEKTPESPMDGKEIKPVNPKGNQP